MLRFVADDLICNCDCSCLSFLFCFSNSFREATRRRSVASTNLNRASSRSHAILTLHVKVVDPVLEKGEFRFFFFFLLDFLVPFFLSFPCEGGALWFPDLNVPRYFRPFVSDYGHFRHFDRLRGELISSLRSQGDEISKDPV